MKTKTAVSKRTAVFLFILIQSGFIPFQRNKRENHFLFFTENLFSFNNPSVILFSQKGLYRKRQK
jgi:hypothetical protein